MKKGILGTKVGMTQVFAKDGTLIPVTVVEVLPNVVTQIKTVEKDGYDAIQLGYLDVREKVSNKAKVGHTKKAGTSPKRFLREVRGVQVGDYTLGQVLDASVFASGEMVDVSGVSKGKGFQGVIKRYNQSRGPMGHGSQYHRGVGSLGTMLPMHVLKGKKLPGHMGHELATIQNLEVVQVDLENNVILIKGSIPGPKKSLVMIRTAVKKGEKVNDAIELITYEVKEDGSVEETKEVASPEASEESSPEDSTVDEAEETESAQEDSTSEASLEDKAE